MLWIEKLWGSLVKMHLCVLLPCCQLQRKPFPLSFPRYHFQAAFKPCTLSAWRPGSPSCSQLHHQDEQQDNPNHQQDPGAHLDCGPSQLHLPEPDLQQGLHLHPGQHWKGHYRAADWQETKGNCCAGPGHALPLLQQGYVSLGGFSLHVLCQLILSGGVHQLCLHSIKII